MKTLNRILLTAVIAITVALSIPASAATHGPVFDGGQESHGKH